MVFDIRTEPWIPVRALTGKSLMMGLQELLEKAHELQDIDGVTPMETYSVYRFLTVFLMDVYRPETWDDKDVILSKGCFELRKIEAYIDKCERAGVCFDIFDKDRPFMQAHPDTAWDSDKNIKYVASLDSTRASGNEFFSGRGFSWSTDSADILHGYVRGLSIRCQWCATALFLA